MAYTKQIECPRCGGTGKLWDYTAKDIIFGFDEVPDHTIEIQCHECLGQGHISVNPEEAPPDGNG